MNVLYYLAFNFIIYSFIGWIIEELYSFFIDGKFKKEGFLVGPFKPMYGIAISLLILFHEILGIDGIPMIVLCFLIPTTVEYISGYLLKHIFNKIYWDYSHLKFNLQGIVTLKFSLYWTFLSFIAVYFLQPVILNIYIRQGKFLITAIIIGSIILLIDFILTVKRLYVVRLY